MTTTALLYRVGNALRAAGYTRASSHRDRTGFSLTVDLCIVRVCFYNRGVRDMAKNTEACAALCELGYESVTGLNAILVYGMASPAEVKP